MRGRIMVCQVHNSHLRGGGCVRPFSRRDRRASCVLTMSNSPASRRSPDERSDIRVLSTSFYAAPGFRFAHPGYKLSLRLASGKQMKEAERRQTHTVMPVRKRRTGRATEKAACAALPLRARSPAGVPLTALAAATERHRSAPVHALPGTVLVRDGRYPPPAVPVQRAL